MYSAGYPRNSYTISIILEGESPVPYGANYSAGECLAMAEYCDGVYNASFIANRKDVETVLANLLHAGVRGVAEIYVRRRLSPIYAEPARLLYCVRLNPMAAKQKEGVQFGNCR